MCLVSSHASSRQISDNHVLLYQQIFSISQALLLADLLLSSNLKLMTTKVVSLVSKFAILDRLTYPTNKLSV